MPAAIAINKADLNDQRWLDQQIAAIDDGIEAVLDIARNWSDLRNLSRLHPGTSAQDYILARVKTPLGRGVIVPLLAESNWSNRQIAAVAGVERKVVDRLAQNGPVDRPAETLGADGKLRPARVVREVVAEVIESDETDLDAGPDEDSRRLAYIQALKEYLAGIVRVQPPTIGSPPSLYRRRHELERRLLAVLAEVMS